MSIFLLPKTVIIEVEKLCNNFLWGVDGVHRKRVKVAWSQLACPFHEGGIGLRDLGSWNIACNSRHLWSVLLQSGSIWVAWVSYYRLRRFDLWTCPITSNSYWIWRRILKVRSILIPYISQQLDRRFRWNGQLFSQFSVSAIWNVIRPRRETVDWDLLVWQKPAIPAHCLLLWLMFRDRLSTKDKLVAWGIGTDHTCLLCDVGNDTRTISSMSVLIRGVFSLIGFLCGLFIPLGSLLLKRCCESSIMLLPVLIFIGSLGVLFCATFGKSDVAVYTREQCFQRLLLFS
ncbi:Putative ribonuclease H protein At1g65750 [Linum grandiflorum]